MERNWKLGDDLSVKDNILDGITFDDLITAVQSNCPAITPWNVERQMDEILEKRLADMRFLLRNNIMAITRLAKLDDAKC